MKNVAIIGSGSWGVALATHLARNGNNVRLWSFNKDERDLINNEKKYAFVRGVIITKAYFIYYMKNVFSFLYSFAL